MPAGRIGMTFCPGKQQAHAATGTWKRDLALDVAAVRESGAAVVVSLVEPHELDELGVPDLGDEVRRQHMDWLHLPIADVSVPTDAFEQAWLTAGEGLRTRLRNGFDVVVHCKGGLGRAGMIAARLLVELGTPAEEAIAIVRAARPGAIETTAQERYVHSIAPAPELIPSTTPDALQDRALGALLGLAVGDALGTTLEFKARDSYEPLTTIVGGGPFRLKPGQWTDDTAMALALADSLIAHPELDQDDLMQRFDRWQRSGAYSCTGTCFDIGITVSSALARWRRTGDAAAGSTDPKTAGNGALMRLAPVALRWAHDPARLVEVAARQTVTTHAAPEAISASVAFAQLLAAAIAGEPLSTIIAPRSDAAYRGTIAAIMDGSWHGKRRDEIQSSGYVAHSLEAALWATARTTSFRDAVLLAANLGGDADTTAAITGQLAGAIYGASGIPQDWLAMIEWRERITELGLRLIGDRQSGETSNVLERSHS
ncbi:ADP-ribosylglycohydrolase family protein [Tsuneonella amylolytica]|uniref:ADP-ribosylglycohydrolase family protein n=1 Tax=Tsuneonella amylolytica TaxID=2338327 RepID=UPI001F2D7A48|nr:ADP-ribosylglycohydrolase family protein [Tsuneonella amylolytica]